MSYKEVRTRYFLWVRVIIFIAFIGLGILIFTNLGEDPTHTTFSLIAFLISVAALLVTLLQSITISRQMQLTEKAAREVRDTGEQLKYLVRNSSSLRREVEEDIELDHEIISVLEEHGLGEVDARRKVAHHIARKIKDKQR